MVKQPTITIKFDKNLKQQIVEWIKSDFVEKSKVKEFIKLEQKLVKSLATRKQIESNPLLQKVRDKMVELKLK